MQNYISLKSLTDKQAIVAQLIAEGLSNGEIASQMGIKEKTVKEYITKVYKQYKVKHRGQFIVKVLRQYYEAELLKLRQKVTDNNSVTLIGGFKNV